MSALRTSRRPTRIPPSRVHPPGRSRRRLGRNDERHPALGDLDRTLAIDLSEGADPMARSPERQAACVRQSLRYSCGAASDEKGSEARHFLASTYKL